MVITVYTKLEKIMIGLKIRERRKSSFASTAAGSIADSFIRTTCSPQHRSFSRLQHTTNPRPIQGTINCLRIYPEDSQTTPNTAGFSRLQHHKSMSLTGLHLGSKIGHVTSGFTPRYCVCCRYQARRDRPYISIRDDKYRGRWMNQSYLSGSFWHILNLNEMHGIKAVIFDPDQFV